MKKLFLLQLFGFLGLIVSAQNISARLDSAYRKFENDSQLAQAISSLYVVDGETGNVVFNYNEGIGMETASTMKIITAATAFELLGEDFHYKTELGYDGKIEKGILKGNLYIKGSGDPTLGSWRWKETSDTAVIRSWVDGIRNKRIRQIIGNLVTDESGFESQSIPDGWIWQDIGNYFGAGAWALNWKENQYDMVLKSGSKIGEPVQLIKNGLLPVDSFLVVNEIKSAGKGTGDNGYIYLPPYGRTAYLRGTIPVNENRFPISGSLPHPAEALSWQLKKCLNDDHLTVNGNTNSMQTTSGKTNLIAVHESPSLDSMVYWFLKKSINLYGEALLKTFAFQKNGFGSREEGIKIVKEFWKERGLAPTELNMVDGSGLSPVNRVTTHAQVTVLQYAKNRPWFNAYYYAFPEYNGMKMKSGTINNAKGFCGYHRSKEGKNYIFSFLVNNYNGPSATLVQKMYKVLDELK